MCIRDSKETLLGREPGAHLCRAIRRDLATHGGQESWVEEQQWAAAENFLRAAARQACDRHR
eukprot:15385624-Alexandrium_andersonii.AAC.1